MKVLLFLGNGRLARTFGGSEKVYCEFANEFARRGWEVGAMHDDFGDAASIYPLDERVRRFNLNDGKSPPSPFSRFVAKICREIARPFRASFLNPCEVARKRRLRSKIDAVLQTFRPDVVLLFSLQDAEKFFYRRPQTDFATIQMTHSQPSAVFRGAFSRRSLRKTLDRCDVVQVLLDSFAPYVRELTSTRVVSIPNVVPQFAESVDVDERERAGSPRIIYVGRLSRNKRQRLLVEAFAKIAERRPDWTVCFFGDASLSDRYRQKVEESISQKGLENRVFIYPPTKQIKEELLKSDIFAFPSAYEGFSLALTEAQSLGLPAVGFADAPSVNELIVDGENGFLAQDLDDFAQKLDALIDSKELRRRFGANAKKAVEKYEASRVWDVWERLLVETIERKKSPR